MVPTSLRTVASSLAVCFCCLPMLQAEEAFPLRRGDHIAYIGNTLADRMQHSPWLETLIHALHPQHELTVRNLAFPGDELKNRPREENFGSPDQWLTKCEADVVFAFFGYNEALRGDAGLEQFRADLAEVIAGMRAQKYSGESPPRLVMFSPIAHENLHSRHLPDGSANNRSLESYTAAMRDICERSGVRFVDLFAPTLQAYAAATEPLTINGVHLNEHGNAVVARVIVKELFGSALVLPADPELQRLYNAVFEKNDYWFNRYRVVDGYNVYGGRSRLEWFGQTNADVMMREMEIFDVMTANRDRRVWSVAQGGDLQVADDNLPPQVAVRTNKPGPLEGERHPYYSGEEAMRYMHLAEGMQVNLFASEDMFPEVVNPVQMAVDTDGRLFVSVWPSYPHWNPTEPRRDRILCLPDDDGDGVADRCVVFADELNSVTGFEFWGGGMLVAALPELWFLQDTDGDDRADVKIRMLQGLSSADSHHSANAMVFGPDGWVYWSRGIFNVATMETPTQTYRSTQSGVHRFNPRTFEMEFHFPIGPNPHGDVFDQWGYQFANDGTSGTGSYVNIGRGIGNRQWFEKRVRPVAATGILSSSHFPPENQGNFLICNTIGVLGVLQHKVEYSGADIRAVEVEPILLSDDQNFRPSDVEIGGDGALYIADWCNVLIGHMQHNMRDPNRDHSHGRIYRVTYRDRPLLKPFRLRNKSVAEVCEAFLAKEITARYHARIELSGRDPDDVVAAVTAFADGLDPMMDHEDRNEAQALLECLWVFADQRLPNPELVTRVYSAKDPRIRSAAIRTLGQWHQAVTDWQPMLLAAARDESPLVRAEAIKAAALFDGLAAAEVVFEAAALPMDSELDQLVKYATSELDINRVTSEAIASGATLSPMARNWMLKHASAADLLKLERTEAVCEAILAREDVTDEELQEAASSLASFRRTTVAQLLVGELTSTDPNRAAGHPAGLGRLLAGQPAGELAMIRDQIEPLATSASDESTRIAAYAAWVTAAGTAEDAFLAATRSKERLRDFLAAVSLVRGEHLQESLYAKIRPLISDMPANLEAEPGGAAMLQPGIAVDFYYPSATDVAIATLDKMEPRASGIVPEISMNVPQRVQDDRFALRFTGSIQIDRAGTHQFFVSSDDGSRIYIDGKLLVDNDGLHGMSEKGGSVELTPGMHAIVVTYFDNGGGDGLSVAWSGPRFRKQPIPADRLFAGGGETLHDLAIQSLAAIPGHGSEKVTDLAAVLKAGRHRDAAIQTLRSVPVSQWPQPLIRPMIDNLVGYLTEIPPRYRTGPPAQNAMKLAEELAGTLPADQGTAVRERLQNLDVRVIAIGTVPHRMIFDKEQIVVEAGKPVEFRFSNTDDMPHNFAVTVPGALQLIGELAEATGREPDAQARHYIPNSPKILLASRLLQTGQNQSLSFDVPAEPGVYPFVCTYPGHWRRMFGALYVVPDLQQYQADPAGYLAAHPLKIQDPMLELSTRGREWTFEELIGSASPLPEDRSFEVGRQVFRAATCISCHKLNNEGQVFGPDLAKLDEKKHTTEHILRSLIDPSRDIDDKYRSQTFVLTSGKVLTGMIVEETSEDVRIIIDPLARTAPTVIARTEIEEQRASPVSMMPKGLLDKLSAEEILDLIAFVYSGGDQHHGLFAHEHKH